MLPIKPSGFALAAGEGAHHTRMDIVRQISVPQATSSAFTSKSAGMYILPGVAQQYFAEAPAWAHGTCRRSI